MKIILPLLAVSLATSIIALIKLYRRAQTTEVLNEKIKAQNIAAEQTRDRLSKEIEDREIQLEKIKKDTETQNSIIKSLNETAETLRLNAENRAEESYKARVAALEIQYKQRNRELDNQLQLALDRIKQENENLSNLEAKQLAYIKAQQRQLEMENKKDFYRLEISDSDKSDIDLLREMQNRFVRKEAIDKLIWEVYFKKPYDVLMSHLSFDSKNKICGIYKITDIINGKIYIGQASDVRERLRTHIKTGLSSNQATNKLYQAMKKEGVENFTFELLEEVSRDKLNEREKYWIGFYKSNEVGLNGTIGGS